METPRITLRLPAETLAQITEIKRLNMGVDRTKIVIRAVADLHARTVEMAGKNSKKKVGPS